MGTQPLAFMHSSSSFLFLVHASTSRLNSTVVYSTPIFCHRRSSPVPHPNVPPSSKRSKKKAPGVGIASLLLTGHSELSQLLFQPMPLVHAVEQRLHAGLLGGLDVRLVIVHEEAGGGGGGRAPRRGGGEPVDGEVGLRQADLGRADDRVEEVVDAELLFDAGAEGDVGVAEDGGPVGGTEGSNEG